MKQSKTVVKLTHYQEGTVHEITFTLADSFTEYAKSIQRYNDATMLDEYYRAEKMFTIQIDEDDEDALGDIFALASLQMDRYIAIRSK